MPRTGRPKSENPKKHTLSIRLTDEEYQLLKQYAKQRGLGFTAMVRQEFLKPIFEKKE